jgi:hypothetical protein
MTEITVILKFFCFELDYFSTSLVDIILHCHNIFILQVEEEEGGLPSACKRLRKNLGISAFWLFFPDAAFQKRIEFGSGSE